MKSILFLAMSLTTFSASANSTLSCKYFANGYAFYLNANIKSAQELGDVTEITYDTNTKKTVDHKNFGDLTADESYQPKQYKGYVRFYVGDEAALILPPHFDQTASFETRLTTLDGPAHDAPNTSLTVRCTTK